MSKPRRRFVISDLGFGYAVHDTGAPQDYAFPAGKEKDHLSSNQLNSERVGIFATREEALRLAERLNLEYGPGQVG